MSDKVALVIGNQQYECDKLKGLFYSEKDAYDVAQALYTLGFKVRIKRNICAVIVTGSSSLRQRRNVGKKKKTCQWYGTVEIPY